MKPSLTFIFSGIFLAFIGHSIWNLIQIFRPPICNVGDMCYSSYLNQKPSLDLLVYITDNSYSRGEELVLTLENFNYNQHIERYIENYPFYSNYS